MILYSPVAGLKSITTHFENVKLLCVELRSNHFYLRVFLISGTFVVRVLLMVFFERLDRVK